MPSQEKHNGRSTLVAHAATLSVVTDGVYLSKARNTEVGPQWEGGVGRGGGVRSPLGTSKGKLML